jgi:hypothetical protein
MVSLLVCGLGTFSASSSRIAECLISLSA